MGKPLYAPGAGGAVVVLDRILAEEIEGFNGQGIQFVKGTAEVNGLPLEAWIANHPVRGTPAIFTLIGEEDDRRLVIVDGLDIVDAVVIWYANGGENVKGNWN